MPLPCRKNTSFTAAHNQSPDVTNPQPLPSAAQSLYKATREERKGGPYPIAPLTVAVRSYTYDPTFVISSITHIKQPLFAFIRCTPSQQTVVWNNRIKMLYSTILTTLLISSVTALEQLAPGPNLFPRQGSAFTPGTTPVTGTCASIGKVNCGTRLCVGISTGETCCDTATNCEYFLQRQQCFHFDTSISTQ